MFEEQEAHLANQIALRHLRGLDEDRSDYNDHFFPRHDRGNVHSAIVSETARRIAKAAFSSPDYSFEVPVRIKKAGQNTWDHLKNLLNRPGTKEVAVISVIMALKVGLYFAYKNAAREGLQEVIDL